jgi:hypothetical protein
MVFDAWNDWNDLRPDGFEPQPLLTGDINMRWLTRLAIFILALGLGTSAWSLLGYGQSRSASPDRRAEAAAPADEEEPRAVPEPSVEPGHSIRFGPVEPMVGQSNKRTVILRATPDAGAPVIARLKLKEYEAVDILGATRDFLHVKIGAGSLASEGAEAAEGQQEDREGWTTWDAVVPEVTALVLDAETGAVVSRVPLTEGLTSLVYSPDGSRAVFGMGADGILQRTDEVRTSDYRLMRTLKSTDEEYFGVPFYGPADGALYAAVYPSSDSQADSLPKLSLIRLGEDGAAHTPTAISAVEGNLLIAPDGQTGFLVKPSGSESPATVAVLDLATLTKRNSFIVNTNELSLASGEVIIKRDGTELYAMGTEQSGNSIFVLDAWTGQRLRELPVKKYFGDQRAYMPQQNLVGDSLLLRKWDGEGEHGSWLCVWLGAGGSMAAEREIYAAVEAGGARYAVNEEGTRLFKLDKSNHIQTRTLIERPEMFDGAAASGGMTVFGLSASPDGKRLILFLGIEHDGC